MINFEIANFRGAVDAKFSVGKRTIICGANYHGKSSIAQVCGAVLTGDTVPFKEVPKHQVKLLIHDGNKQAMVVAKNGENTNTITYPEAKLTSVGEPLFASKIACGMESVMEMKPKDRQVYFESFLNSEPTEKMLRTAISEIGLDDEAFGRLWQDIKGLGWNTVWSNKKANGAKLKAQWEYVTKTAYGKLKAEEWLPEGWLPDLLNMKVEVLEADLNQTKEWLDAAIKETAISESEIKKLTELANQKSALDANYKKAFSDTIKINGELQELKDKDKYEDVPETQTCPYAECRKPITVKGGKVIQAKKGPTVAEIKKMKKKHGELRVVINEKKLELEKANLESVNCSNKSVMAINASKQLGEIKSDKPKKGVSIDDVREKVMTAEQRLEAFNSRQEAYEIHKMIEKMVIAVKALASDGLRLTVLNKALKSINYELRELSPGAEGWKDVQFGANMNVLHGGRPYSLCSESEQWRAKVTIQLLIAKREKSILTIIDRADILDKLGRNELLRIIIRADVPTLIFMKMDKKEEVPDLAKIGGQSYWIEEGVLSEVSK